MHVCYTCFYRATANAYARSCYGHLSVCLSVCPCVCLPSAWIVTKRNNNLSVFQHRTTERYFYFLEAKFRGPEFKGSPPTHVVGITIQAHRCRGTINLFTVRMRMHTHGLSIDVCPSVRPSVKCVNCDKTK